MIQVGCPLPFPARRIFGLPVCLPQIWILVRAWRKIRAKGAQTEMVDQNKSDLFLAPTQELPRAQPGAPGTRSLIVPTPQDEERFREEQEQIREMIASGAPLNHILVSLVLMIERQSADMICSILLLSADDGNHVRHAVAPVCRRITLRLLMAVQLGLSMAHAERPCTVASP